MKSVHKDRIKLVKIGDRSNECEHPVPVNHQEIARMSHGLFQISRKIAHVEMVRLVCTPSG